MFAEISKTWIFIKKNIYSVTRVFKAYLEIIGLEVENHPGWNISLSQDTRHTLYTLTHTLGQYILANPHIGMFLEDGRNQRTQRKYKEKSSDNNSSS